VKYRINSSALISGNERSCSNCSSENIFSDNAPLHVPYQTKPERT
jgi:hypothetical protein